MYGLKVTERLSPRFHLEKKH